MDSLCAGSHLIWVYTVFKIGKSYVHNVLIISLQNINLFGYDSLDSLAVIFRIEEDCWL